MVTTKCIRCGKILFPDRYGYLQYICEDCLTYTERYLRKKKTARLDEKIKKYEQIHNTAHENSHEK